VEAKIYPPILPLSPHSNPSNHTLPRRARSNPPDLNPQVLLNKLDILPTILGQVLKPRHILNALLPPGQLDILHLNLGEGVQIGREVGVEGSAVQVVRHGNFERLELIQDVQLGEVEQGVPVDEVRVLHHDEVEPTTTAATARRDAKLGSHFLEVLADGLLEGSEVSGDGREQSQEKKGERIGQTHVELLGRERTSSNASSISLDHTHDLSNRLGGQSQPGANSSNAGRGGSDKGVSSEIEVEHQGVGAFDEDALLGEKGLVEEGWAVDDVGLETRGELLVAEDFTFGVVPVVGGGVAEREKVSDRVRNQTAPRISRGRSSSLKVTITLDPSLHEGPKLLGESLLIKEMVNTETGARSLGRVRWADALLGGTDGRSAQLGFLEAVDNLVKVEDEVSAVREEETAVAVEAWEG
jgi:hypothetical protein